MINLTKTINQINGTPFKNGKGVVVTLKDLILSVLANHGNDEKDGVKKLNRFQLSLDVNKAKKEIKLTAEQIVDLKELGVSLPTVSYGRLCELIE